MMDTTTQTIFNEVLEALDEVNMSNKQLLKSSDEITVRISAVEKVILQKQSGDETVIPNTKAVEQIISNEFAGMQTLITTRLAAQHVTHEHHLHKGIVLSVLFFITTLLCLWQWINMYQSKKQYQANDTKYRSLMLAGDTSLSRLLYKVDSIYKLNKDSFELSVISEEQRLAERAKLLLLADEKEKEAKELKERAGRK